MDIKRKDLIGKNLVLRVRIVPSLRQLSQHGQHLTYQWWKCMKNKEREYYIVFLFTFTLVSRPSCVTVCHWNRKTIEYPRTSSWILDPPWNLKTQTRWSSLWWIQKQDAQNRSHQWCNETWNSGKDQPYDFGKESIWLKLVDIPQE